MMLVTRQLGVSLLAFSASTALFAGHGGCHSQCWWGIAAMVLLWWLVTSVLLFFTWNKVISFLTSLKQVRFGHALLFTAFLAALCAPKHFGKRCHGGWGHKRCYKSAKMNCHDKKKKCGDCGRAECPDCSGQGHKKGADCPCDGDKK